MTTKAGGKMGALADEPNGKAHHGKDENSAAQFSPRGHCGDDCMEQAKINVLKSKGLGERRNFWL